MLIPLLLALALSPLASSDAAAAQFDTTRCLGDAAEMVCYVPKDCASSTELVKTQDAQLIESCPALLAIRPYTAALTKWLVVMRGKGLDADGLRFYKVANTIEAMLFECKPNGDKSEVTLAAGLTKDKSISMFANPAEQYHHCEFEVSFATAIATGADFDNKVKLVFSQSGTAFRNQEGLFSLVGDITKFVKCNPDDIKLESTSTEQESYSEVDAHRLKVECLAGKLTYKSGADYSPIDSLTCEEDPAELADNKFKYKAGSNWIAKGTELYARCAQNRCVSCLAVNCPQADCASKPPWTQGSGDTCAKLECAGDRYEVAVEGGEGSQQLEGKPDCLDGAWSIKGTPFKAAACFVKSTCPPIPCDNCNQGAASTVTCAGHDEKMTITRADGGKSTATGALTCKEGLWFDAAGRAVGDAASVACTRSGTTTTASAGTAKIVAGSTLVLGCSIGVAVLLILGLVIVAVVCLRKRRRRNKPSSTGTSTDTQSKHRPPKHSSGVSSASTSQASGGGGGGGSTKTSRPALHTAIQTPDKESKESREEVASPRQELSPPHEKQSVPRAAAEKPRPPSAPEPAPQPATPPPPTTATTDTPKTEPKSGAVKPTAANDEDDKGYVVVDPAKFAEQQKKKDEAAAATAAAAQKTGGTQKVGVLPPPGAAAATPPPPLATPPAAAGTLEQATPPEPEGTPLSRLTPPPGSCFPAPAEIAAAAAAETSAPPQPPTQ